MTNRVSGVKVLHDHGGKGPQKLGAWVPKTKDVRRYRFKHFLPAGATAGAVFHKPGGGLDQAQTQACVGHCGRAFELSEPDPALREPHDDRPATLTDNPVNPAVDLYFNAQRDDDWAGGEYPGAQPVYQGSSLHGLIKYMVAQRIVSGPYAWATGPADLRAWLRTVGGVMFASRWTQNMFHPVNGYLDPSGNVAGGHAYYLFGVDTNDDVYGIQSWKLPWGIGATFKNADGSSFTIQSGVFRISPAGQQKLFDLHYAEGVAPVKVVQAPPKPDPEDRPISRYAAMRMTTFDREYQVTKYRKPWATIGPPRGA